MRTDVPTDSIPLADSSVLPARLRALRSLLDRSVPSARRRRVPPELLIGTLIIGVAVIMAVFAPVLAPRDYADISAADRLRAPSVEFPFGTDEFGRDVLSRVIYGAQVSLGVSFASVIAGSFLGGALGVIAGFRGGLIGEAIMRAVDLVLSFPALLLALAMAAALGPSSVNATIALAVIYVPLFARIVRAAVLSESSREYVEASRTVGVPELSILIRHVVPNVLTPFVVMFSVSLAGAVLLESALSYLGLGTQPPAASWGKMLSDGRNYIQLAPWLSVFPGLAVTAVVFAFYLVGDAFRDLLDPHSK